MPIIAVDDVGTPVRNDSIGNRRGRVAQQAEADRVIAPFGAAFGLIQAADAIVERGTIKQPNWNAFAGQRGFQETRLAAADKIAQPRDLIEIRCAFERLRIARNQNARVDIELAQCRGKCRGNIREPSGLCEWVEFGSDVQSAHANASLRRMTESPLQGFQSRRRIPPVVRFVPDQISEGIFSETADAITILP